MSLPNNEIDSIVRQVLSRLSGESPAAVEAGGSGHGVFESMDDAVAAARRAFIDYGSTSLTTRKKMIANIRRRCTEIVQQLARDAVAETGLGRVADKVSKNLLVINKTPGPEILEPQAFTGDDGLTLNEWAPYGTLGVITPSTNPTETIINNAIGLLSAGNTAVFNVHPSARKVSMLTIGVVNDAIVEAGGPRNCLTCIARPTIKSAQTLMKHPGVRLLVVTGGPAVVRVAMNSGKKVIAAGPGNPPVVVDETADIEAAGRGIVAGASLDNNIVCIVEKEIFAVASIADRLKAAMLANGAVEVKGHYLRKLEKLVVDGDHPKRAWVGKDASKILDAIGMPYSGDPRVIIAEVGFNHAFVQHELLMPVLGFVRVKDVDQGIEWAVKAEHGFGHTACMWSRNIESLHRMACAVNTSIFVKNAPSFAGLGLGGEGYTSFTIASPTGEGLTTALDFSRQRRCTLKGFFRIV